MGRFQLLMHANWGHELPLKKSPHPQPLSHPTLATPEASPRRVGEGLGVRALFQWKFMAPMFVHMMCK